MSESKPEQGDLRFEMHPTGARAEIITHLPTRSGKGGYRIVARTSDMADAEAWARRIVTAVNAHDDLLAACKVALARMETFAQSLGEWVASGPMLGEMAQLRAAIAKAKEVPE